MANYAISNSTSNGFGSSQAAVSGTYKTLCAVGASTQANVTQGSGLRRGKLYDILIGTNGTPADNYMEFIVQRATLLTSGSAWTGSLSSASSGFALDTADPNMAGFSAANSSNEGQVSLASLPSPWYVGINQRASYRWVAAPGSEILYPAVSSATGQNGLVLQTRSGGYTGTATGNVLLQEQ
jgi:hypothetical protein